MVLQLRASGTESLLAQVKRLLLEELGTYLEARTEVKNYQLTKDEITTLTADYRVGNLVDATSQKGEKDMRLLLILALAWSLAGCGLLIPGKSENTSKRDLRRLMNQIVTPATSSMQVESSPVAEVSPDEVSVYENLNFSVCFDGESEFEIAEIELTLYEEYTEILYDTIPVIETAGNPSPCWYSQLEPDFYYAAPGVAGDYFFTVVVRDPEGHESNEVYTYLTVKE